MDGSVGNGGFIAWHLWRFCHGGDVDVAADVADVRAEKGCRPALVVALFVPPRRCLS